MNPLPPVPVGEIPYASPVDWNVPFPTWWNVGQVLKHDPDPGPTFTNIIIPANDAPGSVAFQTDTQTVPSTAGTISVPVIRTGDFDPSAEVTFNYTLTGTAVFNSDYGLPSGASYDPTTGLVSGTIRYPIGESNAVINIPLFNNPAPGPDKTLVITLTTVAPASTGTPDVHTITIVNKNNFGTFALDSTAYTAPAPGNSTVTVTVFRTGGSDGAVTVPFTLSSGTAVPGVDYTDVSGVISFSDGETQKTITIPILDNGQPQASKTINLTLGTPSLGSLGDPAAAVLTIPARNVTGRVQFSSARYDIREGQPFLRITVLRTGDVSSPITVPYSFTDGTAHNGVDYSAVAGTLSFAAGESSLSIDVSIIDNTLVDGTRTFTVSLGTPSGLALLGTINAATAYIADNDAAFQFASSSYTVNENAGNALLTVTRAGDLSSSVTINFSTLNGSALAGVDYLPASGTLTFAPGQATATVTIPLIDRPLIANPQRSFSVLLSSPGGTQSDSSGNGILVGSPASATVTIASVERTHPVVTAMQIVNNNRIVLTFSKALDPAGANEPRNYSIACLDAKGRVTKYLRVTAATYDPANRTVTLLPLPKLSSGKLYEVNAYTGVTDAGGRAISTAALGSPANFSGRVAFGSSLTYIDRKGNRVSLSIKKGSILYTLFGGRETVSLFNTVPGKSALSGSVKRQGDSDGLSILDLLAGTSGVNIKLKDSQFQINAVS
jgi:hypothetical protein